MNPSLFKFSWKRTSGKQDVKSLVIRFVHPITKKSIEKSISHIKLSSSDFVGGKIVTTDKNILASFKKTKQAIEDYIINLDTFNDFDTDTLMSDINASSGYELTKINHELIFNLLEQYDIAKLGKTQQKNLKQAKKYFILFEKYKNKKYTIKNIDADFIPDYMQFIIDNYGYKKKTLTNFLTYFLKALRESLSRATHANQLYYLSNYDNPINNIVEKKVDKQYIKKNEIDAIYATDFSYYKAQNDEERVILNKIKLNDIRDWMYIGWNIGQRLQTLKLLNKSQIKNDKLVMVYQPKTEKYIKYIPFLGDFNYFETHNDFPSMPTCDNDFNVCVKIICREFGMTEIVEGYYSTQQADGTYRDKYGLYYRWQLMASHTLRRSFVTHYKLMGIGAKTIMAITGHEDENTLKIYDVSDFEDNVDAFIKNVNKFNFKEMHLVKKAS